MANRPTRVNASKKKTAKSQTEINRIKPSGVLSLSKLQELANVITPINVQLGEEVFRFFHLPMTVAQAKEFSTSGEVHIVALQRLLAEQLVNEDGSQFATEEQLDEVPQEVLGKILNAMLESAKGEPGEG